MSEETDEMALQLGRVQERLGDIDAVLRRLDEGTYGVCRSCGRAIPDDRLASDPTARACAGCEADPGTAVPSGGA